MELSFLYAIPRTPALDSFFLAVTRMTGSIGQLWLIVAALLLAWRLPRLYSSMAARPTCAPLPALLH